ncbi:MAG: polyphosphate polymerase domain-containing protein [Caldilineales bacterium]
MIRIKSEQRYEIKYIVRHDEAAELNRALSRFMLPDAHGDDQGHYQVTSLYYDTADYKAYWDKIDGHRNRRKLRVRIYGDQTVTSDTLCFVEIKHRLDRALQKRRLAVPYSAALKLDEIENRVSPSSPEESAVLDEVLYLRDALQLQPTCVVGYRRSALEGHQYDAGLRVTFDTNLKYRIHELTLFADGQASDHYFVPPEWCIMEVKVNHRAPLWLTQVIAEHQCVVRRISKYCTALEHSRVLLGEQRILEQ